MQQTTTNSRNYSRRLAAWTRSSPQERRRDRRNRTSRQRRTHHPLEPDQQSLWRHGLSRSIPTRSSVLGIRAYPNVAALPEPVDLAVIVTPAHTVPGVMQECVDAGNQGRDHHLGRLQGTRSRRRGTGTPNSRNRPRRRHAHHRTQLPRRDAPALRLERDLRQRDGASRQRRLHQPERRALHRRARLELPRKRRLQRLHLDWLDARRRLGRPDRLSGRRPQHPQHRHLHGIGRRRARVPLRRPRSRAAASRSSSSKPGAPKPPPKPPPRTPAR